MQFLQPGQNFSNLSIFLNFQINWPTPPQKYSNQQLIKIDSVSSSFLHSAWHKS